MDAWERRGPRWLAEKLFVLLLAIYSTWNLSPKELCNSSPACLHIPSCIVVTYSVYLKLCSLGLKASGPGEAKRLPGSIVDEIIGAVLLLPLAEGNIQWEVSKVLSATDATPVGGGTARTASTSNIVRQLYRYCAHRGERTRLDWSHRSVLVPSTMTTCTSDVEALLLSHVWNPLSSYRFERRAHVNLQELRALINEISLRSDSESGVRDKFV